MSGYRDEGKWREKSDGMSRREGKQDGEKGNKRWRMRLEERENENRREWEQERVKGLQ